MNYRLRQHIYIQQIDGESILLDTLNNRYMTLNSTGSLILYLLQAGKSVNDVITHLTDVYDVSRDIAQTESNQIIEQFVEQEMIVPVHDEDEY